MIIPETTGLWKNRVHTCIVFPQTIGLWNNHVYEKYLDVIKETHLRSTLSKLRLSSHLLNIETDRHDNIDIGQRICKCCNMKNIESEYHFLLVCPLYSSLRKKHLSNYYCHWPNIQKSVL